MAFESVQEAKEKLAQVAQGGIFSDKNLNETLEWQGEITQAEKEAEEGPTLKPKTVREQEDEQMLIEKVSPAVLAVIAKRVEQSLLQQEGGLDNSVLGILERRLKTEADKIQMWIDSQEEKLKKEGKSEAGRVTALEQNVAKLEESLRVFEAKYDKVIVTAAANGTREIEILHECEKILRERRATDESEVGSMPSIVPRLQARTEALTARMRDIEADVPRAVDRVVAAAAPVATARRRFGKRD